MYTLVLLLPRLALLGAAVVTLEAGCPWWWPVAFFLAFLRGLGCPRLP